MSLTVVVSTYNRSESLERTLKAIRGLADEIIVVDNESTDNTKEIAKKLKATVYTRKNNTMLNINKNFGIEKAKSEWILYLDDDEVVTAELAAEINGVVKKNDTEIVGFWIPRKNIIFGKWIQHGIWWPDQQLRLFRRGMGKYPQKHVHEYIAISGKTEILAQTLTHYNYDTLSQYLWKMQTIYTDNEVANLKASGYSLRWTDAIRFPVSDFIKLYFAQSGYKDGLHGLVLAGLQSFYSFLVFVKLWESMEFRTMDIGVLEAEDEFNKSKKEFGYWMLTAKIRTYKNGINTILWKIQRRLIGV